MNAADIIEQYGRGIPVILQSTMIVDVCAYMRSCKTPAALTLSDRGEVKGVLSNTDIIHASGRLGSSVMQMTAGELARDMVPACDMATSITDLLEFLNRTASDFTFVTDQGTIKGLITLSDAMDLLLSALTGNSPAEQEAVIEPSEALPEPAITAAPEAAPVAPQSQIMPDYQPQPQFAEQRVPEVPGAAGYAAALHQAAPTLQVAPQPAPPQPVSTQPVSTQQTPDEGRATFFIG